jgi:hypothetical protein
MYCPHHTKFSAFYLDIFTLDLTTFFNFAPRTPLPNTYLLPHHIGSSSTSIPVATFLASLGVHVDEKRKKTLHANGVNTQAMKALDKADLQELGFNMGERAIILSSSRGACRRPFC